MMNHLMMLCDFDYPLSLLLNYTMTSFDSMIHDGSAQSVSVPESYTTVVERSATEPVRVFVVHSIAYLARINSCLRHWRHDVEQAARDQTASRNPLGCSTCIRRANEYAPLIGPDGPVFLHHVRDCESTLRVRRIIDEMVSAETHARIKTSATPVIVTSNTFAPMKKGGFNHWTVKPNTVTFEKTELFERATIDYVDMMGKTMLTGLVASLLSSSDMEASMKLFDRCLMKILCSDQYRGTNNMMYRNTTNWMLSIQMYRGNNFGSRFWKDLTPIEQLHAVMYALATSNLAWEKDACVCPNYHEAIIVFEFLRNVIDVNSMIDLINAQCAPVTLDCRTIELTKDQFYVGAKMLGDFTNTVALVSELPRLYASQFVSWPQSFNLCDETTSSASGYAILQLHMKKLDFQRSLGENKAFCTKKISVRARINSKTTRSQPITSVFELMTVLTDGMPHTLYIDAADHAPWLLANTTLDPKKLRTCQKHFWAVWGKEKAKSWGASHNNKVNAVFWMPMGELLFLCEGMQLPGKLGNCNFPEFLAPNMHCAKPVFEALNKITSMAVPKLLGDDVHATGICARSHASDRTLDKNITIVLDGVSHTLTRFD